MAELTVRYWGVRGSIPVPGPTTQRYGGNTSCVEVSTAEARVIVDGGTGLRALGGSLKEPQELTMFFTHLHWDHIQGIPFFAPMFIPGFTIHIYSGHKADVSLEATLRGQMQAPNFPVELDRLPAGMTFNEIPKGSSIRVGDIRIDTVSLNHPNEATGLRFSTRTKSFVHLTDHEHGPEWQAKLVEFCKGADILSMDTMFTPEQYPRFMGWGHSHWRHAVELAKEAGIPRIILFHHAPQNDDDTLDRIQDEARSAFPNLALSFEGMTIEL